MNGKIKWFNETKGYGFIISEEGGEELFFHFSSINMKGFKTLKKDQKVSYELLITKKGKQASNIKPIEK